MIDNGLEMLTASLDKFSQVSFEHDWRTCQNVFGLIVPGAVREVVEDVLLVLTPSHKRTAAAWNLRLTVIVTTGTIDQH